jgi:hypothetical protein
VSRGTMIIIMVLTPTNLAGNTPLKKDIIREKSKFSPMI